LPSQLTKWLEFPFGNIIAISSQRYKIEVLTKLTMNDKDQLQEQEMAQPEMPDMEPNTASESMEKSDNEVIVEINEGNYEALRAENAELKDKYLRIYAEFDTFRRRMMKEKLDLIKTAAQDTMTALLPVLDDFDRAKKSAEANNSPEQFSEGVALVYQKLHNTLKNIGLETMETHQQPFDPEWHEAMAEIPAPADELKGKIIDTIEKGYVLGGKIIRHAKVVIGK
jgi:molecular chaperone GrpE